MILMKRATVYQRGAVILVHASSRTTDGVWILSEPCIRLPSDCGDAAMGLAVMSALEASQSSVPHPTQWKGLVEPLLRAAGVRTWKAFAKSAVCVEVEERDGQLALIPAVNLGSEEGFRANESKKREIAIPSEHAVVGVTLREVLAAAQ